ncbi:MAG TPA: hypothetical protein VN914_02900 [Polyangia bacterium]|nr:hypothetical protein [Polyangia bacterium]
MRRLMFMGFLLAACNGGAAAPPDAAGPAADAASLDPQLPPQGHAALEAWLAAGLYRSWTCEAAISNKRLNGAHGRHRICSNRLLVDSLDGPYPVGAASVKEMYASDDRPNGYAVGVKVAAGLGEESWYWYERTGTSPTSSPVADGVAVKICGMECHAKATRDHVYIRADGH